MTEVDRTLDQLRRAFRGPAWHGPAVMEALTGVTAARATARAIPSAHTIWEITRHIAVWEDVVRRRIEGEKVEPTPAEDWPEPGEANESAWKALLQRLEEGHDRLEATVRGLDDARLIGKAGGSDNTVYLLVHGAIQHDLYHAGQIALLAK